jgi:hypothetical protein
MAVARNPNHCYICGQLIKEKHQYMGRNFIGDTFIGYESHVCDHTSEKYIKWAADREARRNSPEGQKEIADIKKMFEHAEKMGKFLKPDHQKKVKTERTQMDDLNDFLREIADNDKVGIRRKLVAIKRYIANIMDGSINK